MKVVWIEFIWSVIRGRPVDCLRRIVHRLLNFSLKCLSKRKRFFIHYWPILSVYVALFYKLINVRLLKINQQNDCEFVRWWHWLWWHNVHICKTCVQMAPCRLSYGAARGRLLLARGRLHVECRWKDGFACASGCGRSNDGLRTLTARRLYPTRLETRTKESNMCASLRAIETRWA